MRQTTDQRKRNMCSNMRKKKNQMKSQIEQNDRRENHVCVQKWLKPTRKATGKNVIPMMQMMFLTLQSKFDTKYNLIQKKINFKASVTCNQANSSSNSANTHTKAINTQSLRYSTCNYQLNTLLHFQRGWSGVSAGSTVWGRAGLWWRRSATILRWRTFLHKTFCFNQIQCFRLNFASKSIFFWRIS